MRILSCPLLLVVAPLLAVATATAGCSAADPSGAGETGSPHSDASSTSKDAGAEAEVPTSNVALTILPTELFSGVDGTHTFQVPVSVYGGKGVTLKASDDSVVSIVPAKLTIPKDDASDDGEAFLVTTKKAGRVTLTASLGSARATSEMVVAQYAATSWAAGQARYLNGATSGPACTQCHAGASGKDHSPSAIAGSQDQAVMAIITTGILNDFPIRGVNHRWQESGPVLDGLVTYLRALPPKGYAPR